MSTAGSPGRSVPIILASSSATRQRLLRAARVAAEAIPPNVDEEAALEALVAEGLAPRDIADALAEAKAQRIAGRADLAATGAVVIGADQVLELDGAVLRPPESVDALKAQLRLLRGRRHTLQSAVVVFHDGNPVWRHVGRAAMSMRMFGDAYLDAYVERNWPALASAPGGYRIEEEGARLFDRIEGDFFTVLGLPLLPLLGYLGSRGWIDA